MSVFFHRKEVDQHRTSKSAGQQRVMAGNQIDKRKQLPRQWKEEQGTKVTVGGGKRNKEQLRSFVQHLEMGGAVIYWREGGSGRGLWKLNKCGPESQGDRDVPDVSPKWAPRPLEMLRRGKSAWYSFSCHYCNRMRSPHLMKFSLLQLLEVQDPSQDLNLEIPSWQRRQMSLN